MKILFTTNKTWAARIIRYATSSPISHVALLLDEPIVAHSTMVGFGANLMWYGEFLEHNQIVESLPLLGDHGQLIKRLAISSTKGYDYVLLFSMWLQQVGILRKPIDNPYRDICTEVISQYLLNDNNKYTPGQLLAKLRGN